ncbi:MAG TPA: heavy-metal-associated domain-containing protein [Chitinophagaceae bacterium]|nr:heavy-metal-associated domain-containing protein [Chitinophagaceae bacterium]
MKKLLIVIAVMMTVSSYAQISKATLVASGLTCSMCSKAIYEALQKVKTIETIKANIKESSYNIVFKNGTVISFDDIRKSVEDAGFSVAKLQITINFDNVEIKNDAHILMDGLNLHFLHVESQTLNGEKVLTLVDKKFESAREYKKYTQYTTMKCFETGVMEACCSNKGSGGERIYHVTI